MSSSNLAVRMDPAATDLLSDPPRNTHRTSSSESRTAQTGKLRISITNRKLLSRAAELRYFRIR